MVQRVSPFCRISRKISEHENDPAPVSLEAVWVSKTIEALMVDNRGPYGEERLALLGPLCH